MPRLYREPRKNPERKRAILIATVSFSAVLACCLIAFFLFSGLN